MRGAALWALLIGCGHEPATEDTDPVPSDTDTGAEGDTAPPAIDLDGDGFSPPLDCNDLSWQIYPGSPFSGAVCRGGDYNCDGIQDGEADADGDGFTTCDFRECDDGDPSVFPGAPDPFGDGIDQGCDGTDGVGLAPTLFSVGDRRAYAHGENLLVADVNGDGCEDLVFGASGPTMRENGIQGSGGNQSRIHALLGCGGVPGSLVYEADEPAGMSGVLHRVPGADRDRVLTISWSVTIYVGEAQVLDLVEGALVGPSLEGNATGDMHDGVIVNAPGQAPQLVVGGVGNNQTNPARGFYVPWTGDFSAPDVLWYPDPDPSTVLYGQDLLAFDRDDDGADELVLAAWDIFTPDGSVLVLDGPVASLDDASEVWLGDPTGFGTHFGAHLFGARDLHGDGAATLLVGSRSFFGDRGGLVSLPPLGPGTHSLADVGVIAEGEYADDWFGSSVAVGDVNGDGHTDLVVGAPGEILPVWPPHGPGKVYVWLGPIAPDALLSRVEADAVFVGIQIDEHLGWSLAILDLDGDGVDEIYASAPFHDAVQEDGTVLDDAGAIYRLDL